jgi:hypothetical protein
VIISKEARLINIVICPNTRRMNMLDFSENVSRRMCQDGPRLRKIKKLEFF